MDARLETGLFRLAELMVSESEPWWIIGSTAMVLSGVDGVHPDDIDVVASSGVLRRVLARAAATALPAKNHNQFRSSPYGRIKVAQGFDIEVQGDLELRENGVWTPIIFASRVEVMVGNRSFFLPDLAEQLEIFRRFGRAKDLAKATMLESALKERAASAAFR